MKEVLPGGLQPDAAGVVLIEAEEELYLVDEAAGRIVLILPDVALRLGIEEERPPPVGDSNTHESTS